MRDAPLVGVTGAIGTGKTLLSERLSDGQGWPRIDADAIGHEALRPGSDVLPLVIARFGRTILKPAGGVDRTALASVVFQDPTALADLNRLVHPWILREIARRRAALLVGLAPAIILLDAAMLPLWIPSVQPDAVILVRAPEAERRARLLARGMARAEADRRIAAQQALFAGPIPAGWIVVDNDGTREALEAKAEALAQNLIVRFGLDAEMETS